MQAQGGDPSAGDAKGKTPIHLAAWEGHAAAVAVLAGAGQADAVDHYDGTALQAAASQGHERCVRLLLSHRVRPERGSRPPLCEAEADLVDRRRIMIRIMLWLFDVHVG